MLFGNSETDVAIMNQSSITLRYMMFIRSLQSQLTGVAPIHGSGWTIINQSLLYCPIRCSKSQNIKRMNDRL